MQPRTIGVLLFVLLTTLLCFSQQEWVSRYDAYTGYSFLTTPTVGLFENGFNGEFGVNVKTWVSLGGDFSIYQGSTTLVPNQLSNQVLTALGPQIAKIKLVDPSYQFLAPYDATTYTFAGGPQFNYRKLKSITFFARPALGGLHQSVTINPKDPYTKALVIGLVGNSMKKSDFVLFYGFGGGMDFNVSKHLGLRTAADVVWYDAFSGTLKGTSNSIRFSVGPTFRFGPNIVK